MRRSPRVRASALALAAALIAAGLAAGMQPAAATEATGGEGNAVSAIQWMTWGQPGAPFSDAGATQTELLTLGDLTVDVDCTIGAVTGTNPSPDPGGRLAPYRPGDWQGDGLDDMYNIGGTGPANQLINGLANRTYGDIVSFTFSCSATSTSASAPTPQPFPLAGLVVADAEQLDSNGEFISAQAPVGATWRIIDRFRSQDCSSSNTYRLAVDSGNTLRLDDPSGGACSAGPTAVAFLDGGTSADVTMQGTGYSAIALGVIVALDQGDAPASYGSPAALVQAGWTGGTVGTSSRLFDITPATPAAPTVRLGAAVDTENGDQSSAAATGDDDDADINDEDGYTPSTAVVLPGETYTSNAISCSGAGASIGAWIDWNRDGAFDAGERTSTTCANGTASASWTVPSDVAAGPSFLRLRIASLPAGVADPVAFGGDGEVEDYAQAIDIPAPTASPDAPTTEQNTPVTFSPIANDAVDPRRPSSTLTASRVRLLDGVLAVTSLTTADGSYSVDTATGQVTFTPAAGFTGTATTAVTYRVSDSNGRTATTTITPVVTAVAPTASPDVASTGQDQTVTVDVLDNDGPGNVLTPIVPAATRLVGPGNTLVTSLTVPGVGTFTVGTDGAITLDPEPGFVGTGTVTYSIADADGTRATSTLAVNVAVAPPVGTPDTGEVDAGGTVTLDLLANDRTGLPGGSALDPASVRLIDPATGQPATTVSTPAGTFALTPGTGLVTFTPADGFVGTTPAIAYTFADLAGTAGAASVTVTVRSPLAALAATGVAVGGTTAAALVLVAVGAGILLTRRRRAATRP